VQLEHNLVCATNPALTVRGHLDLNGFKVACHGHAKEAEGVVLAGYGAILRNGTVEGCFRSVVVAGWGGHLVTLVKASGTDRAFSIESRGNRVLGNQGSTTGNDAFRISSSGNLLAANAVTSAGSDGFGVRGRHNTLADNEVKDVGEEGFDIRERFNVILSNTISATGDDGIQVRTGDNRIIGNHISGALGRGILVGGFLSAGGAHNEIIGNRVEDGDQEGINVDAGFVRQRILHNTALNNRLDDLRDQNPDCDDNLWLGNTFGTADPEDCIH